MTKASTSRLCQVVFRPSRFAVGNAPIRPLLAAPPQSDCAERPLPTPGAPPWSPMTTPFRGPAPLR